MSLHANVAMSTERCAYHWSRSCAVVSSSSGKRSSIFARSKRWVEPIEIAVTAIPVTSAAEKTATTIRVGRLTKRSCQAERSLPGIDCGSSTDTHPPVIRSVEGRARLSPFPSREL